MDKKSKPNRDYYQEITDKVIAELEKGIKPWERPWDPNVCGGSFYPINAVSKKRYRGINTLILGTDIRAFETGDSRWCSFQQAKSKGWNVKKGEQATLVFFFKKLIKQIDNTENIEENENEENNEKVIFLMRAYPVFHASQIDNIPKIEIKKEEHPLREKNAVDIIMENSNAIIRTGGDRAFYSPSTDHIQLPPENAFKTLESYNATRMHELGHWTGSESRLNRDLSGKFRSHAYAREELRAELASLFMGFELGLTSNIENHASYLSSWLEVLKTDKKEIFRASADAQKIANFCLNFHPEYKDDNIETNEETDTNTKTLSI